MNASPLSRRAAASSLYLLAGLVALVLATLALRPTGHVYDMPMTEDGYYALSVARNLAAGSGITIDGVNLTNGFQPLFTMLQGGAFWAAQGDEVLAMRLAMALGWLFHVGGAFLVALIARDAWPSRYGDVERSMRGALAAIFYLASPLMLNHAYNGLETGCVMFFYAAAARWLQTDRDRSTAGLAGYGIIIGLLVLARIDSAFVAVVLGLNDFRRSWRQGVGTALGRGIMLAGVALLVSSPWWIYNTVYFGSPMPTSGTAQQAWGLEFMRLEHAEWALRLVLMPWVFAGAHEGLVSINLPVPFEPGYMTFTAIGFVRSLLLFIVGVALLRWLWRGGRKMDLAGAADLERHRAGRTIEFLVCFLIAFAALIAYYAFTFIAYWFYYRYFAPLALIAFVLVPLLLARWTYSSDQRSVAALITGVLVLQIVALTMISLTGRGLGGNTVYHDQVALLRQHVPPEDRVAAGQSGTLGFFRDNVVNTDGKVNREALAFQDHMWDYLRERQIKWFVDWPFYVNKYLGVPLDAETGLPASTGNGWRFVAERNYFYLYEYTGPDAR